MSDSCNREDLKMMVMKTRDRTIETPLIQDGDDILLPVGVLAELLNVSLRVDHSQGILHVNEVSEAATDLDEDLKKSIQETVCQHSERICAIAREIYEHPEIGDEEERAAMLLSEILEETGFQVTRGLKGKKPDSGEEVFLETAFLAEAQGQGAGPTLAVMLEYDALPMGHGCGHNLIAASGLAAAIALKKVLEKLPGHLRVMGTPAEEGGVRGGKVPMIAAGYFEGVDVAMITHGGDRWDTGSLWLAVKSVTMTFTGTPAHAAAAPHQGRSALDALVLAYHGIEMMREHVRSDTRIHGIVKNGGAASNIVPEEAVASYGVRSLDNRYLQELMERVDNVARGAALASGCQVETRWSYGYSAPINVPRLDEKVMAYAKALGAGPVKPWTALASSDLGNVGEIVPTVNLWFAIAPEGTELHTKEFLEASGSAAGAEAALLAGTILAMAGAELLANPQEIKMIQQDFNSLKKQAEAKEGNKDENQ